MIALAGWCAALHGCEHSARGEAPPRDSVLEGRLAIQHHGCGACHRIPGIPGAIGNTGPPLEGIARRVYLAGVIANTPQNMIAWIRAPQLIDPQTAMPSTGASEAEARAIAAYLETLR